MSEFGVSDKEPKKNSSTGGVLGLGVKLQSLEAFPSKAMMMMVHQNHHHRPLSSPFDNDSSPAAGDGHGPTAYMSMTNHVINDVVVSGASAPGAAAAVHSDGAAPVRPLQPFDISNSVSATTTRTAFKSPAGGMAASLGFPFTSAQWRELERQAMIYKYMMASVPVPSDLLIPTSLPPASRSPMDGGFNLRLSSGTDPEPGRCRRTDGKKWRCSRDVAPNHKYCERHMHRGRPRSRKHVEVHANSNNSSSSNNNQQIKRARHDYYPFPASAVTVAISNPAIRKDVPSSQFLGSTTSQPYLESSLSLDKFGVKAANCDPMVSASSDKEPRSLEWMLKGDPVSMGGSNRVWTPLMADKVGLTTDSCCNNNAVISSPNYQEPLYMNSYGIFSSGLDQQNRRCPPSFFNPLAVPLENPLSVKPRGFIDAWSNAETEENNANVNKTSVTSNGKLSLSFLDLSMSGGGSVDGEVGDIQMGLGLMEADGNTGSNNGTKSHVESWLTPAPWVGSSTPGGPLAEVLRPSTVATTNDAPSNPSSPVITNAESGSPLATMVSSPSGVLQKTFTSLSDSSSNSSPTVASSKTSSEIGLLWSSSAN
ncbi:hypothetical protein L6164_030272 [Bauhinia variegata]|uniref:Uncharacterized protein n=1 Tax=Bauhinia variegata TaxID=167791 RepID=A0ACB9LBD4_BAUVA|nr:hypothetical protein L6164_030272 [Bauhinia variegata]